MSTKLSANSSLRIACALCLLLPGVVHAQGEPEPQPALEPAPAQNLADDPRAHALADRQSTDPTEPVTSTPLLSVPMPGEATPPPAGEEVPEDEDTPEQAIPGDPWGDVGPGGLLSLRALFQARYRTTFAAANDSERESYRVREEYLQQKNDGFALNRVFLRIGSDPSRYLSFKAIVDFGELIEGDPEDVLKQAYAALRPIPERLEFVVGMFKMPFSVLELDASSRYEFTEMGTTNSLLDNLGYAGRDLGVQVLGSPLKKPKRLRLSLGAFRGHAYDEHDLPVGAVAGRIETKPNKKLRFGAGIVQHTRSNTYNRPFNTSDKDELPNPPNPLYPAQKHWGKGRAYGVDGRFKKWGLMVRGEAVYGDRVDLDERYGAKTFVSAWGLAAYRIDVGSVRLLPAVRYEYLDADLQHDTGVHQQFTGALTVLFWERVRIVFDAVYTKVQSGSPWLNQPKPLQLEPYLALDTLRLTTQLQLEL